MRFFEVTLLLKERVGKDLAGLIIEFCKNAVAPWDAYDLWVPEYNSVGMYGQLPMCPVELPMFTP